MKTIYILFEVLVLAILLEAFNQKSVFSQTCTNKTDKTITEGYDITSPCVSDVARDYVRMVPNFKFSSSVPANSKKVNFVWNYSGLNAGWSPNIIVNSKNVTGTSLPSNYTFSNFMTSITNLATQLSSQLGAGWTVMINSPVPNTSASFQVVNLSDFTYSLGNYNSITIVQYYSAPTNGTFNAKIDNSLMFPADYLPGNSIPNLITYKPDKNLPVGTIPATFNISPNGAANYEIPIWVPIGLGGLEPKISLVYNSQTGNGLLGCGWNLAGLSVISRVPQNLFSDGVIKGVKIDANDKFAIDGNKIVVQGTGVYGADNTEYRTEMESFMKIVSHGTYNGPAWFDVQDKNGNKFNYGNRSTGDGGRLIYTSGSVNAVIAWYLDYVEDPLGNFMTYEYEQVGLSKYLKKILYGCNKNNNTQIYNTVEFFYEQRFDPIAVHYGNVNGTMNRVLNRIIVKSGPTIFRQYNFTYTNFDNSDPFSRLVKVSESDLYGNKYNPTYVKWGKYGLPVNMAPCTFVIGSQGLGMEQSYSVGDFDGDGKDDLIYNYYTYNEQYNVATQKYEKSSSQSQASLYYANQESNTNELNFQETRWKQVSVSVPVNCKYMDVFSSRVTGNFKKDAILPYVKFGLNQTNAMIFYNLNLNSSYTLGDAVGGEQTLITKGINPSYASADINNDGYDEIILLENQQATDNATFPGRIYVPRLNKWVDFNIYSPIYSGGHIIREPEGFKDYYGIFVADYNGDGLNDIMLKRYGYCKILLNQGGDDGKGLPVFNYASSFTGCDGLFSCMKPGDFNGDGLQDFILCERNSSNWWLALNNGNLEFTRIALPNITLDQYDDVDCYMVHHETIVLDFNGDGKSDIIVYDADNGKVDVQWFQSTGINMVLKYSAQKDNSSRIYCATSGDFNGDGRLELLNSNWNCLDGTSCPQANLTSYYMPDANNDAGLVDTIVNGLNYKINLSYKPLTNSGIYTCNYASTYPLMSITAPIYVVNEIKSDNGLNGGQNSISYKYENALIHMQGKGFLGFAKTIKIDNDSKIKTQSYFNPATDIETTYYTLTKQTNEVISTASVPEVPISKSDNLFWYRLYSGKHIFYHPTTSTSTNFLTNLTNTTTYSYDGTSGVVPYNGKGNITTELKTFGSTANYVQTNYKEYTNAGSYIENKPQLIETWKKNSDDATYFTTQVRFTYDPTKGYIKTKTEYEELSSAKKIVTTYTYDPKYNVVTGVSVAYPDKNYNQSAKTFTDFTKTLATTYTYTTDGKFLKTKTEPLNFVTEYNYDCIGNLLSEKAPSGFITSYEYNDPFNELSKTINPDGTWLAKTIGWTDNSAPQNYVYYTSTTATASASVTTFFDVLGRQLRTQTPDFNTKIVYSDISYNTIGKMEWQSLPYYSSVVPVKKYFTYDEFGRNKKVYFDNNEQLITNAYDDKNSTKITTSYSGSGRFNEKTTDPFGNISITKDGKDNTVKYTYKSMGRPSTITVENKSITGTTVVTSMEYDEYGNQTVLNDPSAGRRSYIYNAIGQLYRQTDEKPTQNSIVKIYDDQGRMTKQYIGNQTITYIYDTKIKGCLSMVTNDNGTSTEYFYDATNGRLTGQTETVNLKTFTTNYEYDRNGNLVKTTYPSGFITLNEYDGYGYGNLIKIKEVGGTNIWQATNGNALGLITNYTLGNNKHSVTMGYDKYGSVTSISTPGVLNFQYAYYPDTRNLSSRKNITRGLTESFSYDELDRLKTWGTAAQYNINYKGITIDTKNDAGTGNYIYQTGNYRIDNIPGAVTDIQKPENILYNEFNKIAHIDEYPATTTTGYSMDITYSTDGDRKIEVLKKDNNAIPVLTRYFACGNYEQEERGTAIRQIDYIAGASAIHVNNGGQDTIYYLHTDNQGSWLAVTNNKNTTVKEQAFDPWGRRRIPTNWALSNSLNGFPFVRGYTGHEHMDVFGLINMNGRVYDPVLGMFLSTDNFVQDPMNPQNFNRYSYCLNNPLKYTDPSGDFFWMPLLYTAAQSGLTNFISQASQGNINSFGDALSSFSIGAIGGAARYGASNFSNVPGALGGGLIGGLTGGLIGGITSGLSSMSNGHNFSNGFWPGALYGGISGTVSGAIAGYNLANEIGANELTGTLDYELKLNSDEIATLSEVYSENIPDGYLSCVIREEFGYGVGDLNINKITSSETPSGYNLKEGLIYSKEGDAIGGVTRSRVFGKTSIYMSPLVASHSIARLVVGGHELVHAWDDYYNFRFRTVLVHTFYTEHNAYSFQIHYMSTIDPKYQDQLINQLYLTGKQMLQNQYSYGKYSTPPFFYKTWAP
jgi:RHS repeat-associated protein